MKKLIVLFVLTLFSASLFAQSIREVVFFGDSLSDNGNLYRRIKIIPKSPPYYAGQFSNGPVWSEHLSAYLRKKYGVKSQNYAVGGATVILRSPRSGAFPYSLRREINNYINSQNFTDKASVLYFLWMGGNDYIDEKNQPPNVLVKNVVDELVAQVRILIENGGKNFVMIDLPDFSKAPFAKDVSKKQRDRLKLLSQLNHQKFQEAITLLQKSYPAYHFIYIDGFTIFNDMMTNIQSYNQKYHKHIVNLIDSCWLGGYRGIDNDESNTSLEVDGSYSTSLSIANQVGVLQSQGAVPCKSPDDYLFWDSIHPTAATHDMLSTVVTEVLEEEFNFVNILV